MVTELLNSPMTQTVQCARSDELDRVFFPSLYWRVMCMNVLSVMPYVGQIVRLSGIGAKLLANWSDFQSVEKIQIVHKVIIAGVAH